VNNEEEGSKSHIERMNRRGEGRRFKKLNE